MYNAINISIRENGRVRAIEKEGAGEWRRRGRRRGSGEGGGGGGGCRNETLSKP